MEVENECYDNEFLEKISILVVDDDTSSLLITSELLKKENFKGTQLTSLFHFPNFVSVT